MSLTTLAVMVVPGIVVGAILAWIVFRDRKPKQAKKPFAKELVEDLEAGHKSETKR